MEFILNIIFDIVTTVLITYIGFKFGRYSLKDKIRQLEMELSSSHRTIESLAFELSEERKKNL